MRRAAVVAIALVVVPLLLLRARSGQEHSARGQLTQPPEIDAPGTAPVPETAAAESAETTAPEAVEPNAGTIASGHVTDADGKPLAGLRLLAIPRDNVALWEAEDPFTPPGEDPAVPFAKTDEDGVFGFRGLPRGDYRLTMDESNWMLEQEVLFRADTRNLQVVAVGGWCALLTVRDLATDDLIPNFVVRYRWPWDAVEERVGHGRDGVFRVRQRTETFGGELTVVIEADGYHRGTGWCTAGTGYMTDAGKAWLVRAGEPELTLRVVFDDGVPCEEDAEAWVHDRHKGATVPAVGIGSGRYRVPVPKGEWSVDFRPKPVVAFRKECSADVELTGSERPEVFLELERGGNVVVRRKDWNGTPWSLMVQRRDLGMYWSPAHETTCEIRHLTPGTYSVFALDPSGTKEWHREIEVTNGSRHELTIE